MPKLWTWLSSVVSFSCFFFLFSLHSCAGRWKFWTSNINIYVLVSCISLGTWLNSSLVHFFKILCDRSNYTELASFHIFIISVYNLFVFRVLILLGPCPSALFLLILWSIVCIHDVLTYFCFSTRSYDRILLDLDHLVFSVNSWSIPSLITLCW